MARPTEVIVQAMLGDSALRIAALTSEVERLTEALAAAKPSMPVPDEAPRLAMARPSKA